MIIYFQNWAGIEQPVQRLTTGRTVRGSNLGVDKCGEEKIMRFSLLHTCPDRPWSHPASCTVGTGDSLPEGKWPGRGADHPTPSSAEVKERIEL